MRGCIRGFEAGEGKAKQRDKAERQSRKANKEATVRSRSPGGMTTRKAGSCKGTKQGEVRQGRSNGNGNRRSFASLRMTGGKTNRRADLSSKAQRAVA